ncbi:MAG: DUF6444 domain-containing protein [Mangrovibacterium sp.]
MKDKVGDIASIMETLTQELQLMRQNNDAQYTFICQLNRNIERLLKENKELRKRLSKYEQPYKDSSNSSTPPSKETLKSEVARRTKSLRKKSGKPVGGQRGHQGSTRKMEDNVDEIIEHNSAYCQQCGNDLSDTPSQFEYAPQEIDIPIIEPIIREHRHSVKVCSCGCSNRSYAPRTLLVNEVETRLPLAQMSKHSWSTIA